MTSEFRVVKSDRLVSDFLAKGKAYDTAGMSFITPFRTAPVSSLKIPL